MQGPLCDDKQYVVLTKSLSDLCTNGFAWFWLCSVQLLATVGNSHHAWPSSFSTCVLCCFSLLTSCLQAQNVADKARAQAQMEAALGGGSGGGASWGLMEPHCPITESCCRLLPRALHLFELTCRPRKLQTRRVLRHRWRLPWVVVVVVVVPPGV